MAREIHRVNKKADIISSRYALEVNITAAKSLMKIMKTNLGPRGTLKMLVTGAGQLKLTKDGSVLLNQMQIEHPTAALIARTASAQDQATGDGTTTCVLLIGELLRQAERFITEGIHPRIIVDGYELAKNHAINFIDNFKETILTKDGYVDREKLIQIAKTSLRSKLYQEMADHLTEICVDAILNIYTSGETIDLNMIEVMTMCHRLDIDTRLIRGLVLDHGTRHPDMNKSAKNCKILFCNINLEWEHTEVNSAFYFKSAMKREEMAKAEREFVNKKIFKIVDFKNKNLVKNEQMVLINQGGIDSISLDILQKNNIMGIRRAKRRNMERLSLACGGYCVNTENELSSDCLGSAERIYEHVLGDEKYTFIEGVPFAKSVTILIKGPNNHTITQIKDAVRDGLRAVKNSIIDGCILPGAGAFEVACRNQLLKFKDNILGRTRLGIEAMAEALLIIPKTLAINSGLDSQDSIIKLIASSKEGNTVGLDIETGDLIDPLFEGIFDNYSVKKQYLQLSSIIATKLLLVDQIIKAGKQVKKN